jgi:hypothetical protein
MQPSSALYTDVASMNDQVPFRMDIQSSLHRYIMGGDSLELEDFQQVVQRFGKAYSGDWAQAVQIVGQVERATLGSQRKLFEDVYKPRRDE